MNNNNDLSITDLYDIVVGRYQKGMSAPEPEVVAVFASKQEAAMVEYRER